MLFRCVSLLISLWTILHCSSEIPVIPKQSASVIVILVWTLDASGLATIAVLALGCTFFAWSEVLVDVLRFWGLFLGRSSHHWGMFLGWTWLWYHVQKSIEFGIKSQLNFIDQSAWFIYQDKQSHSRKL